MTGREGGEIGSIRVRSAPKFGDKEILTWRFRIFSPFGLILFRFFFFGIFPHLPPFFPYLFPPKIDTNITPNSVGFKFPSLHPVSSHTTFPRKQILLPNRFQFSNIILICIQMLPCFFTNQI